MASSRPFLALLVALALGAGPVGAVCDAALGHHGTTGHPGGHEMPAEAPMPAHEMPGHEMPAEAPPCHDAPTETPAPADVPASAPLGDCGSACCATDTPARAEAVAPAPALAPAAVVVAVAPEMLPAEPLEAEPPGDPPPPLRRHLELQRFLI